MAKKKDTEGKPSQENSIIRDLREQKWLYNPVIYSQISGDFTMLQQRVLAGILEKMQEKILRSINEKQENERFPSLFSEEEMNGDSTVIEIAPSYFGISPEHYDYLEEALKDLSSIRIGYPRPQKDKMNYVIAPLFSRLEIPMGANRRTGKVRVVMLNENLQDFFSMDKGYTEYLSRITKISKKVRTPRIYIFLSTYQDYGKKKVLYEDFCKFLGIDDETAREDRLTKINELRKEGKITQKEANERLEALAKWENPFRKWNKVKSQILDPAKLELDTFSENEEIDITFDYEPLYEGDKKRGNPSHILFTIIKKRLAIVHEEEKRISRTRHQFVKTMCERYRDLRGYELRAFVADVPDDLLKDFIYYAYHDIKQIIERQQPDNQAAYIMTLLANWLKQKKHVTAVMPEELFTDDDTETQQPDFRPGDAAEQWAQLLNEYDGPAKSLLMQARYLGLYNGAFYVELTKENFLQWDEKDDILQPVYKKIRELLGLSKYGPAIVRRKI